MSKKITFLILGCTILISCFLHFYRSHEIPMCFNADEAAFGYNAYALLKTGMDEHGAKLPLRLQSFNDFKLPLYSYLSIPFIAVFGLSEFSTRLLNKIIGILLVPLVYLITKELFGSKKIALVASFLTSLSPWIYILSRQAHEGVLSAFFVLSSILFILKFQKTMHIRHLVIANTMLVLSTFAYHTGRIFLIVLIGYQIFLLIKYRTSRHIKKMRIILVGILVISLMLPFLVDSSYGANRVQNLLFVQTGGFQERLDEYLREHPVRAIHNKGTAAIKDITVRYFSQISTQFLLIDGDQNPRFGFNQLGIITPIEYIFTFIGLYYLFRKKQEYRWLILLLLVITPFGNALTWQNNSIIRTYFLIFPIIFIVSYGAYNLWKERLHKQYKILIGAMVLLMYIFFNLQSLDIYYNHYFQRSLVIRSWQCGYKELVDYVNKHYDTADSFYITLKHGQPYIYFLFYNKYDPAAFRNSARASGVDEYGFTQIESFDKFIFNFPSETPSPGSILIGYPDDFIDREIELNRLEKITIHNEEIFWMYRI